MKNTKITQKKIELEKEIDALKKRDLEKSEIIKNLENYIEMYERAFEMSRQELMQANATLNAQNIVSEMTRQELISKDKIIQAQQWTLELSGNERKEEMDIINAWKAVIDLARRERLQSTEIIHALEQVEELSARERKQKDIEMQAMENVINFSIDEKMTYKNIACAYKRIQALSDAEKLHILKLLEKKIRFDYEKIKNNTNYNDC